MITDAHLMEVLTAIPPEFQRTPGDRGESVGEPKRNLRLPDSKAVYSERTVIRAARAARKVVRLEQQQRRQQTKAVKRADQSAVLSSIKSGAETWGQIVAALELEAPRLRSALRALVRRGEVVKVSARKYGLG